jgi:hypothetical protein
VSAANAREGEGRCRACCIAAAQGARDRSARRFGSFIAGGQAAALAHRSLEAANTLDSQGVVVQCITLARTIDNMIT